MAKRIALGLAMISLMAPIVRSEREERILNDHYRTNTLRVYIQDIIGGPLTNLIPVAGAPGQPRNSNTFGTLFVAGPPARLGLSLDSPQIGTIQGIKVSINAAQQFLSVSLYFTNREYNGSTMEFQGIFGNEISLVGGTKDFRGVSGYATLEIVQQNPAANSTIIKAVIFYKFNHD